MKNTFSALVLFLIVAAISTRVVDSQARPGPQALQRPPITGVAYIMLRTSDFPAAEQFYGHILGLPEVRYEFSVDVPPPPPPGQQRGTYHPQDTMFLDGSPLFGTHTHRQFEVNDHQYVEIVPGLADPNQDRLVAIAFETTDTRKLRDYLSARNVEILGPTISADNGFMVRDPDGHMVAFVEYVSDRSGFQHVGDGQQASRISQRMIHVGITVQDRAAADRFYHDILGFHDICHGGMTDTKTDWVDMRVPEGTDWLEYMLNSHNPTPRSLGVMHHMALGVPSVAEGYKTVVERGFKPEQPKIGRDGKWQLNLYDPNGTRVELMEPKPVQTPCCSPILN
jgi:catechol 2,3-dioxygenase-like lactoylglutathione lyase family enzyme